MIEELKLMLPLLQQAGEGAFWLAVAFIAKDLLVELLVAGVLLGVVWLGTRTVLKLHGPKRPELSRLDAAYEAVREAWLYGKYDKATAHKVYECHTLLKSARDGSDKGA